MSLKLDKSITFPRHRCEELLYNSHVTFVVADVVDDGVIVAAVIVVGDVIVVDVIVVDVLLVVSF